MSYTPDVAKFTELLGPFYEYVADDLKLPPLKELEAQKKREAGIEAEDDDEDVSDSGIDMTSKVEVNAMKETLKQVASQVSFKDVEDEDETDEDKDDFQDAQDVVQVKMTPWLSN